MEKSMRELLERSFDGKRVITYIESIEQDNMLLTRENKALADECEMKCELNQKLDKALDKTCEILEEEFNNHHSSKEDWNKEQWKEWAKKDE